MEHGERLLAESENLLVLHCHEYASIYCKRTKEKQHVDDFYGDPECALIGPDDCWVLIGGEHLTLWLSDRSVTILDGLRWVHSLRLVNGTTAAILTDPWHPESAIWSFDVSGRRLCKWRDFPDYREEPYTDNVDW